ncbi:hypothetical protein [Cupriavidus pinatubonensis]|uniref:Uncharacterized protein n=1 Tax=Cupriavidus pinatubonensis TaxID=248026 RepID=A0ABM8Y3V6_9BURK|nr:hypothetical protein [Cupriavidus pinatubonensis]CAG9187323.1 hypothetical protein LMG23994_06768 [Cupriavidus pinatubonensis]
MKFSILLPDFRHTEVAAHDADRLRAMRELARPGRNLRRIVVRLRAMLRGWRVQPR